MAEGTFSREDFEKMQGELSQMYDKQQKITGSLSEYYEQLKKISSLQRDLKNVKEQQNGLEKDTLRINDDIKRVEDSILKTRGKRKKALREELKELHKALEVNDRIGNELSRQEDILSNIISEESEHINHLNRKKALTNSIAKGVKNIGGYLKSQTGYLFDQQKALKVSELSMGVLSNQSATFRKNIISASQNTNILGVDTKALAQIQQSYSDQVGRGVLLTQDNLEAMAELSQGTLLGAEGATQMAAQMEVFGIGARQNVEYVEDIVNSANTMGLNADKVLKNTNKGLRMMNALSFKDGVKGMAKMAADAAKLGYEMESIAPVADKLFNPEGAIEMAAKLQVLGGEFAKIADPFTLMYQARNAPEELAKSLYEAAGASAHFNEKTGEFEVAALELHRLKEVASATGLNYEEMALSAKKFAGINMAKAQITGNFDEDTKDYLANIADLDEKGKFVLNIKRDDGEIVPMALKELSQLTEKEIQTNITRIKAEKATLKERAKNAQTFDETFSNLVNTFKSFLLPAFEAAAEVIQQGLMNFTEWAKNSKMVEWIKALSHSIGDWIKENPVKTIMVGLASLGLFKLTQWYLNGVTMGLGFNSVAGGGMNGASSSIRGAGGGIFGKMGKGVGIGKNAKAGLRSGGAIGGGILSAGISGIDEWSQNSANGMSGGENAGRTTMRAGGAGLGAWGGAALGAAIGTAILPGIGTLIGGALGGIGGGMGGDAIGDWGGDKAFGGTHQDFVMRPGQAATPFTSKDTLIGLKDGGPIEKSFSNSNVGGSSEMTVSFKPIKVEFGTLNIKSGNSSIDLQLDNDPIFVRNITRRIMEELRKTSGGGIANVNPI